MLTHCGATAWRVNRSTNCQYLVHLRHSEHPQRKPGKSKPISFRNEEIEVQVATGKDSDAVEAPNQTIKNLEKPAKFTGMERPVKTNKLTAPFQPMNGQPAIPPRWSRPYAEVAKRWQTWQSIGASQWVLKQLQFGLFIPWARAPQKYRSRRPHTRCRASSVSSSWRKWTGGCIWGM